MARCRIFLFAYRRNNLLPRAIRSVLDQTFTDWVCEVHNDDPNDIECDRVVAQFDDPRIKYVRHPVNFGPVKSYNLAFAGAEEDYVAMLQDDNWWEPSFLSTMIEAMDRRREVQVATANQKLWQEEKDGSWTDTEEVAYQIQEKERLLYWPSRRQVFGAVHADGASIVRSSHAKDFRVPEETIFDNIELFRERAFPTPLLYIGQPLANFAITQDTARSQDPTRYAISQILVVGSFFRYFRPSHESLLEMIDEERQRVPRRTNTIMMAALLYPGTRYLFRYFTLSDWGFFFLSILKRLPQMLRTMTHTREASVLRAYLNEKTAARAKEALKRNIDDFIDA